MSFERNLVVREDLAVAKNVFSGDNKWKFISILPPAIVNATIEEVRNNLPTNDPYMFKVKMESDNLPHNENRFNGLIADNNRALKDGEQWVLFLKRVGNGWAIGTDSWPFTDSNGNTFDNDNTGARVFITQIRCGKRIWFEVVDDHIKAQAVGPQGPAGRDGADGQDGAPGAPGADSQVPGPAGPPGEVSNSILNRALGIRDSEINTLSSIVFNSALPQSIRDFARALLILKHPDGTWVPTDQQIIKITPTLQGNDYLKPVNHYRFGENLPSGTTHREQDVGGIETNKNNIVSFAWQQVINRPADNNVINDSNTILKIGNKRLIRLNNRGIDVDIGRIAATNGNYKEFVGIGALHSLVIGNNIFPETIAVKPTRIKLKTHLFFGDETVARETDEIFVSFAGNSNSENFTIPIRGQQSITGTATYDVGTDQITVNITGGVGAFSERIQLDLFNEVSHNYNYPAGTLFSGLLVAVDHPEIFNPGIDNVAVFAFEKQFPDEPDAPTNLMKLIYRINQHSGELNLRATRQELFLSAGNNFGVGLDVNMQATKIQATAYTGSLSKASILTLDPQALGLGQIRHTTRNATVKLDADDFVLIDGDGNETSLKTSGGSGGGGGDSALPTKWIAGSSSAQSIVISNDINNYDFAIVHIMEAGEERSGVLSIKRQLNVDKARIRISGSSDAAWDVSTRTLSRSAGDNNFDMFFTGVELVKTGGGGGGGGIELSENLLDAKTGNGITKTINLTDATLVIVEIERTAIGTKRRGFKTIPANRLSTEDNAHGIYAGVTSGDIKYCNVRFPITTLDENAQIRMTYRNDSSVLLVGVYKI